MTTQLDTPQHPVEMFADAIRELRVARLERNANGKRSPRERPILSDIPDCDREIVYGITNWKDRPKITADLKARFEAGDWAEKAVKTELMEMGFDVTLEQEYVEVHGRDEDGNKILLSRGKIDGVAGKELNGVRYRFPIEIKSMNPNIYRQIKNLDSFQNKPHLRKYLRQIQMYLFGKNMEAGLFIITDCLGNWKIVTVYIDLGECEWILKRLEKVHNHLKNKTMPDRVPYAPDTCGRCHFAATCIPDIFNKGVPLIDKPQMDEDLERMAELEPYVDEWEFLDAHNKDIAKAVGSDFFTDKWGVILKEQKRTHYNVPDDIKLKYAEVSKVVKVEFSRIIPKDAPAEMPMPTKKDLDAVKTAHGIEPKKGRKKI